MLGYAAYIDDAIKHTLTERETEIKREEERETNKDGFRRSCCCCWSQVFIALQVRHVTLLNGSSVDL